GEMTGSFVDNNTGKTFGFTGGIGNDGSFSGKVTDGATQFPISGVYRNNASAGNGGNFQETRSGTPVQGSFVISNVPISQPSSSPFQGAYNGSYNLNGGTKQAVSFSVDQHGNIVGSLTNPANGTTETGQLTA